MKPIVIAGSSNTDLVAKTSRIPSIGETVIGNDFFTSQGGKGANQAAAAAKLGGEVIFIAKLGDDSFGKSSLESLKKLNINTTYITIARQTPSGVALISIDEVGRNSIIVAPGANSKLSPTDIDQAEEDIKKAGVIVSQLEIPLETVEYIASISKKYNIPFILDPAPARSLTKNLLAMTSIIKPNETEASELTGINVTCKDTAIKAAEKLLEMGPETAIITLGSNGVLIANNGQKTFIDRIKVEAIDSTAAGDAFTGALAFGIAKGASVQEAAEFANFVAALSVTKLGAQQSLPSKNEVDEFIAALS